MRKRFAMKSKRVALAISVQAYSFQRQKIQGIIDYYAKHCLWEIQRNRRMQPFVLPVELLGWKGDGVIAEIYTEADAEKLLSLGVPLVNTSSAYLTRDVPTVGVDNHAIGRLAAEHLVECKLDNFAFIGPKGLCYVQERLEGFSRSLKNYGGSCRALLYESRVKKLRQLTAEAVDPAYLKEFVGGLKFPVGIMASTDRVGFSVLEACHQLGLRSPDDVALVGVDDDDIYCQLAHTSMTSIQPNARKVGFQAAALLDDLMNGTAPEKTRIQIPPQGLVLRSSTDTTRSKHPEVATTLRFIRNRAHEFIAVSNILDVVPVSRRWLEVKFKAEVGHGIYEEIRRVHIERAKKLLETTDLPVQHVVRDSGFNSAERFNLAFNKLVGMSASAYRKKWSRVARQKKSAQIKKKNLSRGSELNPPRPPAPFQGANILGAGFRGRCPRLISASPPG